MNDLAPVDTAYKAYCTFRIEQRLHGIAVAHVREVSPTLPITPVPQAPPAVRGMVNLRSRIYLAIDLRPLLGLSRTDVTADSRLIILKTHPGQDLALLVERGGDIVHVRIEQIEPLAAAGQSADEAGSSVVIGACKLPSELLLAVDPTRIVDAVTKQIRTDSTGANAATLENAP